ncbi:MAG: hypothetical protein EOP09_00890 [Proteobacteria bacterium]|nr:MAG: hypothetical protein EOP09_00890 [Pseudomonadota bacterium]
MHSSSQSMSRTWIRSIIIIFISFSFGFVIGTIPVQSRLFPAYSQWVSAKEQAKDQVNLNQSSRLNDDGSLHLPEPGSLDEKQLIDQLGQYPLYILQKAEEAKVRLIDSTQILSFFSRSTKPDDIESQAQAYRNQVHGDARNAKIYRARGQVQLGNFSAPYTYFLSFPFSGKSACWKLQGVIENGDKRTKIDRESCTGMNDFVKFQDIPYSIVQIHEDGIREWISYLAIPIPELVDQPVKLLSLDAQNGFWKEESPIEWTPVEKSEVDRTVQGGVGN